MMANPNTEPHIVGDSNERMFTNGEDQQGVYSSTEGRVTLELGFGDDDDLVIISLANTNASPQFVVMDKKAYADIGEKFSSASTIIAKIVSSRRPWSCFLSGRSKWGNQRS